MALHEVTWCIKREGLLYFEKYGTGGPEFGIKEEFGDLLGDLAQSTVKRAHGLL